MSKKGSLSINSENIFPIIKKWLYSDHDIFIRELVSNACDAVTKLKKLSLIGEFESKDDKYKVEVLVSAKNKTITFIDNGIGMTEEEIEEYINQIAFSGAADFLEKYKDKANDDQIIGHFGLGFYSAFMVADKVSIETLSYKDGSKAVYWESNGGTEFEMKDSDKDFRGTKISLYLNEDSYEFANEYRVKEILDKYCSFMPVEIYFIDEDKIDETETVQASDLLDTDDVVEHIVAEAKMEEKENDKGEKELVEVSPAKDEYKIKKRPTLINETTPLWAKHPNECSEEDYKNFYRKVFRDYKEPLFWIHLNMDYPFNLKGILYFPKINTEYDSIEGTIKLYNNQVFIADNIKEVIPEFLMLLKGVIDCPDLPLNVSRSALQNDGFVKKISEYISKKVADKLSGMCKTERENYEKYWDDIAPFIKFGCLKDEKFASKMNDYILFKNIENKYNTLANYYTKEEKKENEDVKETKIYYVSDEKAQATYINMFKENGKDAVILTHNIDTPFISNLEMKNEGLHFYRIDADVSEEAKTEISKENEEVYEDLKKKVSEVLKDEKVEISIVELKDEKIASMITISEEARRMEEMMKQYGMMGLDPSMFGGNTPKTLVLNANSAIVKALISSEGEKFTLLAEQLFDMALLNHASLEGDRLAKFIARTSELMLKLS
jgi:Molecular chaperone, HSP90 family